MEVRRIGTPELEPGWLAGFFQGEGLLGGCVLSSVVPAAAERVRGVLPQPMVELSHRRSGGLRLGMSCPESVGADRIANALGCSRRYGMPCIAVDFGTATTFDVVSEEGVFLGGVIAPGRGVMDEYLPAHTALLPQVKWDACPDGVVGQDTAHAMRAGAFHGYRGMVREILNAIRLEAFPSAVPHLIATGGDAHFVNSILPVFDHVDPDLTLYGLLCAAQIELAGKLT